MMKTREKTNENTETMKKKQGNMRKNREKTNENTEKMKKKQ